jgi:hypothetical protein
MFVIVVMVKIKNVGGGGLPLAPGFRPALNILQKNAGAAAIRGHTPSLALVPSWFANIRVAVVTVVLIVSLRTMEGRDIIWASVNNAVVQ